MLKLRRLIMKNLYLRKKALIIFFISSFCFILLTVVASRLYINIVKDNYNNQQASNDERIGYEFSRIILFYAENDPDLLVSSDLLPLYARFDKNTHMCILLNDRVLYGESFFKHIADSQSYVNNPHLKIGVYELKNRPDAYLEVIQLVPEIMPPSEDINDFDRFDLYATLFLIAYLIFLTSLFMIFLNRILRPLEDVKKAAYEIKSGNLDYEIAYEPNDEIGEVFDAIEEMRNELKTSDELRRQYENNRNELFSNITHDLKTPITSIKGYVEGIMDGVADTPDKINKYARTIYKHTTEMDTLIKDLFLMSKLDVDALPFDFEILNINDFLTDCYEDYIFDLHSKGIEFSYENALDEPAFIKADRQNLMRALVNIINNSTHYMDKSPGELKMSLEGRSDTVIIRLRDNGKGIPQDQLEDIFTRFYRVDGSRNSNEGGSGIGLSIVKKIITKHQGLIEAKSQLGEWTEMSIQLPMVNKEFK